jgi:hypothetical protein
LSHANSGKIKIQFYEKELTIDEAKEEISNMEKRRKKEVDSGYPNDDLLRRWERDTAYLEDEIKEREG